MFAPSPLPRSLEASFRDLASDRARTRISAVHDLVRHALRSDASRSRAIPSIEKLLRDDASADVRAQAAVGLADMRASEALSSLLVAVEDGDAYVRQMALMALGEIGDRRAVGRLERALRDERPEIRYQAILAFSQVAKDDPASVADSLAKALDDEDKAIRYVAMRVVEERSFEGASLHDPRITQRAEQLVDSPDEAVAVVASLYLARRGQAGGLRAVLDVVSGKRKTPELEDEQACIDLVGELDAREATPDLERRAWGKRGWLRVLVGKADARSRCAWNARIALARMGHRDAKAEILRDLGSFRRGTREAAVVAAGRARMTEARSALEHMGGSVDAALLSEALDSLAAE